MRIALGAVGLALAVWPLVSYALRYPTAFNDRVGDVFLLGAEALQGRAPLAQLDEALGRHALMFHAVGDQNGRRPAAARSGGSVSPGWKRASGG